MKKEKKFVHILDAKDETKSLALCGEPFIIYETDEDELITCDECIRISTASLAKKEKKATFSGKASVIEEPQFVRGVIV